MDAIEVLIVAMPLTVLVGGIAIVAIAMWRQTKVMEMRHRERMALIERGLAPSPESDPARFDAADSFRPQPAAPHRYTTLGVALVGIGLGLMMMIGFAGEAPGPAVGIGGAIALLGAAFLVNGYLQRQNQPPPPPPTPGPPVRPSLGPSDPPGPLAP